MVEGEDEEEEEEEDEEDKFVRREGKLSILCIYTG